MFIPLVSQIVSCVCHCPFCCCCCSFVSHSIDSQLFSSARRTCNPRERSWGYTSRQHVPSCRRRNGARRLPTELGSRARRSSATKPEVRWCEPSGACVRRRRRDCGGGGGGGGGEDSAVRVFATAVVDANERVIIDNGKRGKFIRAPAVTACSQVRGTSRPAPCVTRPGWPEA
jgi:hypothetical protein